MPPLKMNRRELMETMQLNHPEKILGLYPGMNEDVAARIFGIDLSDYKSIREEFTSAANSAAERLLEDRAFLRKVENLPFKKGCTIAAVGDSITDDYQSWFEILRHVLNKVSGENSFNLVNAGYSGETTSQMITRFIEIVIRRPAWIFFLAGTNDARRHGLKPEKTVVSLEETEKNYTALRDFARSQTEARLVWITPPPVLTDKIARVPILKEFQFSWKAEDIEKVAEIARSQKDIVIDLWKDVFKKGFEPGLLLPDGLHPSLKGHMEIVRRVISTLTQGDNI